MFDNISLVGQPQSPGQVATQSAPSLFYLAWTYLSSQPLDKWVQAATLCFVVLQTFFLLRDRLRKRRERKVAK